MSDQRITFGMDFDMYDYIERTAERVGVTKSEVVRRMISVYMEGGV